MTFEECSESLAGLEYDRHIVGKSRQKAGFNWLHLACENVGRPFGLRLGKSINIPH